MTSIKLISILGFIWISYTSAEVTTLLDKHVKGPLYQFAMMKHVPKNRQFFAYGNCTNSASSDFTKCDIFRESLYGKANKSSCRVSLSGVDNYILLHDFDDNKVIVYWYNKEDKEPNYYIRFTIVQFPNCSTNEAKIRFDLPIFRNNNFAKSLGTILPKGDKFTVAIDNSGLFGNKVDEQTFDARGNMIGNPISWFKPLTKESIMLLDDYDNKNNVLLEFDVQTRRVRFSLLNENGLKVLNLSTYTDYTKYDMYDISTQYDKLRLCRLVEPSSKVDCNTFDAKGNFINRNTLELNHNATKIAVHNLIDGSFFLITAVATKSSETIENILYINKFTAEGKRIATMELPGFKCNAKKVYLIPYENEKDQHCVMKICTSPNDFDIIIKCFGDEDIK